MASDRLKFCKETSDWSEFVRKHLIGQFENCLVGAYQKVGEIYRDFILSFVLR